MKTILKALAKKGVRWLLVHAEDELIKEIQRHDLQKDLQNIIKGIRL